MSEHAEVYESCPSCGKKYYLTWTEAKKVARDMVRLSGKSRGVYPYWDRHCRHYHVGKATTQHYNRARRTA